MKSSGRSQAAAVGREDADAALLALYERQAAASQEHTSVHNQQELKNQQQFHLAVNRYSPTNRRSSRGGGLTLLFSHANGFHKGA